MRKADRPICLPPPDAVHPGHGALYYNSTAIIYVSPIPPAATGDFPYVRTVLRASQTVMLTSATQKSVLNSFKETEMLISSSHLSHAWSDDYS